MSKTQMLAFTQKADEGLLRSLVTTIGIIIPNDFNVCSARALWDTGSTRCGISDILAKKLELVPTGAMTLYTSKGPATVKTYLFDVALPNRIFIENIEAFEFTGADNGIDALIGMDIITLGDFSITNHLGNTCMSFRTPSCHELDFSLHEN